jgi:L-threonylcarbamoyladenylate synthase
LKTTVLRLHFDRVRNSLPTTGVIDDVSLAAKALADGLLVAFPTETVYGLGVDATNPLAVRRLFEAKGRPSDNPLIVHLAEVDQWPLAAAELTDPAREVLKAFSPGPVTVVVKKSPLIDNLVTANLDTVGIRIPSQPQALQLLRQCGRPIAAPSANRSGRPSCTTWQSVLDDMNGRIDYILRGQVCAIGIESTVVDCSVPRPCLLRSGAVTIEQLRELLPDLTVWQPHDPKMTPPSPGLHHPHYQPVAPVSLFESLEALAELTTQQRSQAACACFDVSGGNQLAEIPGEPSQFLFFSKFESLEQYVRGFYEFLRQADRKGARRIFVQIAPTTGIGSALRDRQFRAAQKGSGADFIPSQPGLELG